MPLVSRERRGSWSSFVADDNDKHLIAIDAPLSSLQWHQCLLILVLHLLVVVAPAKPPCASTMPSQNIHISVQKLQMGWNSFFVFNQYGRIHASTYPSLYTYRWPWWWFYCVGIINAISDCVDVLRTTSRNNNRSKPVAPPCTSYDIFLLLALSSCRWCHVKGLVGIVRSGVRSGLNI